VVRGAVVACCGAALVLPAAITTFGLHVSGGGPVGVRLASDGLALKRTYQGEIQAVNKLCGALPANAAVIFIVNGGSRAGNELAEVVRGMCDKPAAIWLSADTRPVAGLISGAYHAGRRPVLLSGLPDLLKPYGGSLTHVVNLRTSQDGTVLTVPPTDTQPLNVSVWMTQPPR
jgi:hypothetical protein